MKFILKAYIIIGLTYFDFGIFKGIKDGGIRGSEIVSSVELKLLFFLTLPMLMYAILY